MNNGKITVQKGYGRVLLLLQVFPVAGFVQLILLPRLPEKYFYDSSYILSIFLGQSRGTGGWAVTANFFNLLDWFHFTTLSEWSCLLAVIFNIYLFISLMKYPAFKLPDYLFMLCITALLNIYVFRMSKDLIQYLIFILAAGFIRSRFECKLKVGIIALLLATEGFIFRSYYYLVCVLFLLLCIVIKADKKKWHFIFGLGVSCVAGLFALRYLSYGHYMELITIRDSLTLSRVNSTDANTLIVNLFDTNGSLLLFIINYVINLFRILFPLELIGKGVFYLAFVIFQLLVTIRIVTVCVVNATSLFSSNQDHRLQLTFCLIAAYYLVGIIFEPDFGSFIRHESAFCPVLFELFLVNRIEQPTLYLFASKYIKSRTNSLPCSPAQ